MYSGETDMASVVGVADGVVGYHGMSGKKGMGRLVREFRDLHASHIFDVKFDVGRIVRWVISYFLFISCGIFVSNCARVSSLFSSPFVPTDRTFL